MVSAELVPFFSVTVFALLGMDRASFPNAKLAGETVTFWAAARTLASRRKMPRPKERKLLGRDTTR
jgi:hypothetical protein